MNAILALMRWGRLARLRGVLASIFAFLTAPARQRELALCLIAMDTNYAVVLFA